MNKCEELKNEVKIRKSIEETDKELKSENDKLFQI